MRSSDYTDKQIMELSRSKSDDFLGFANPQDRGEEPVDDEDHHAYSSNEDEDIFSGFYVRPVRSVASPQSRSSTLRNFGSTDRTDHAESDGRRVRKSLDITALMSLIDQKMKEQTENVVHAIESLSARLSQLETRTRQIEKSIDELKDSMEFTFARNVGKLRELENVMMEVQGGVKDVRDKQEIAEARLQLEMLQQSKYHKPKARINPIQINPTAQGASSSIWFPPQNYQPLPIPQNPMPPPPSHLQQEPQYTQQFQYYQPPSQSPQPSQPPPLPPPSPQPIFHFGLPPVTCHSINEVNPQDHRPEQTHYVPAHSLPPRQVQPTQLFHAASTTHWVNDQPPSCSRRFTDGNLYSVSESQSIYNRGCGEIPHALPMASSIESGSDSDDIGNKNGGVDEIVDKVVAMGFRRDTVKAIVRKVKESRQVVDFNLVLDKLMNDGGKLGNF